MTKLVAVELAKPFVNHLHAALDTIMPTSHHSILYTLDALCDAQSTSKH